MNKLFFLVVIICSPLAAMESVVETAFVAECVRLCKLGQDQLDTLALEFTTGDSAISPITRAVLGEYLALDTSGEKPHWQLNLKLVSVELKKDK